MTEGRILLDDPDPQPLRPSETVCPVCWLAHTRGHDQCPNCEDR